jgi:hypothetical protein
MVGKRRALLRFGFACIMRTAPRFPDKTQERDDNEPDSGGNSKRSSIGLQTGRWSGTLPRGFPRGGAPSPKPPTIDIRASQVSRWRSN